MRVRYPTSASTCLSGTTCPFRSCWSGRTAAASPRCCHSSSNTLVGFKQQAFERAEVERDRVYRMRSPRFIRLGQQWSHAKLEFDGGLTLEEWVLDRPRTAFEAEVSPLPNDDGWRKIP